MPTTSRPFRDEDDYARMGQLLVKIYGLDGPVYCTIGDLDWWRSTNDDPQAIRHAQLWVDERGEVVGIAWPDDGQVDLITRPDYRRLEEEMLLWAEKEGCARFGDPGVTRSLIFWASESDDDRQYVLRRWGYECGEKYLAFRKRRLADPIPEPIVPPGYALRSFGGEREIEARIAVHRDAFHPSRMTTDKHRRVMRSLAYRQDLDLVVVAPDGAFAAFCILWHDEANRMGIFEPVGCALAHRRRGLARALLCEGMRRLEGLGAEVAHVLSWGEDGPVALLYESVGLRVVDRHYQWTRTPLPIPPHTPSPETPSHP